LESGLGDLLESSRLAGESFPSQFSRLGLLGFALSFALTMRMTRVHLSEE
jgi:hypothetical protein